MNDLRVLFADAADRSYRAQLADAEGNRLGVEVPFTPFLAEDDYEDLRWYLEDYVDLPDGGDSGAAHRTGVRAVGPLYDALFTIADNRDFSERASAGPVGRFPLPIHIVQLDTHRGMIQDLLREIVGEQ